MIRFTVFPALLSMIAVSAAAASYACNIEQMCSHGEPCTAMSLNAKILPERDSYLFSFGVGAPLVLTSLDSSANVILRGAAQDMAENMPYILSLFSDMTLLLSTHMFVGRGDAFTMAGTCQRKKN
ncbi:hypothetical protein [Sulfitobacter sp.]|uniref:hypothetical protein n=1 Tax=Sulfitobacter sp. TaxID=1903071 RepID=UPI003003A0D0